MNKDDIVRVLCMVQNLHTKGLLSDEDYDVVIDYIVEHPEFE